jgi:DNA-directed RNA polymerase subunit L
LQEVWDVLLYQILASNKPVQKAFYEADMSGDGDTKGAIQQQYLLQTSTALKEHVDTFLKQLDELSAKADGKYIKEHPRLPLILSHNEFVRSTFLKVKEGLDPMVAELANAPVYSFNG